MIVVLVLALLAGFLLLNPALVLAARIAPHVARFLGRRVRALRTARR